MFAALIILLLHNFCWFYQPTTAREAKTQLESANLRLNKKMVIRPRFISNKNIVFENFTLRSLNSLRNFNV